METLISEDKLLKFSKALRTISSFLLLAKLRLKDLIRPFFPWGKKKFFKIKIF
jgi:hypothetical protein